MKRWYILIGNDDDQIAYPQGKDTPQQVIDRYKEYNRLKEIWFYGTNGKLETVYNCNTGAFRRIVRCIG